MATANWPTCNEDQSLRIFARRIAETGHRELFGLHLHYRNICWRVIAHQAGSEMPAVLEVDLNRTGTVDNVAVGDNVSIRRNDETRTRPVRNRRTAVARACSGFVHFDLHDRIAHLPGDADYRLGVSIQQFGIRVGGRITARARNGRGMVRKKLYHNLVIFFGRYRPLLSEHMDIQAAEREYTDRH